MNAVMIFALPLVITTPTVLPQATLNPGTATDLQRLDVLGSSRIDQLMKLAASGNIESQLRLGLAYQNGFDSVSGSRSVGISSLGGRFPPSYQVMVTAARFFVAGNS